MLDTTCMDSGNSEYIIMQIMNKNCIFLYENRISNGVCLTVNIELSLNHGRTNSFVFAL